MNKETETGVGSAERDWLFAGAASEGLVLLVDAACVDANPAFLRMFGHTSETLAGLPFLSLVDEADHSRLKERLANHVGAEDRCEFTAVRRSKIRFRAQGHCTKVVVGGRNALMISVIDLTDRVRAEEREKMLQERLARAERMEALGLMASGVAHDLNNVLGPIVSLPDMMTEAIRNDADAAPRLVMVLEGLDVMKKAAVRATRTVDELVTIGRQGRYALEPLLLNAVVERCMASEGLAQMRAEFAGVAVSLRLSQETLMIAGAEAHLMRALENLVRNALEATEPGGTVWVETMGQVLATPQAGYETIPAGAYAVLRVRDRGHGIPAAVLQRIMEPFFSTKRRAHGAGSGLGLSVVHGVVRSHNGFVDIQTIEGQGTTFNLYLPLLGATPAEPPEQPVPAASQVRILIVDDEPAQRTAYRLLLKGVGYTVAVAATGEEALALVKQAAEAGEPPYDLVVLDMIMDGMDGLSTYEHVLQIVPGQKAIVISGHAASERLDRIRQLGVGWLQKPFLRSELLQAIRSMLANG